MNQKKITLIEGTFNAEEAFELLTKLVNYKIQFHQRDDFSKSIRNIEQSQQSAQRIEALSEALIEIHNFLNTSKESQERYKVYSEISIVREA
jgi:hypothetical protein